LEEHVIIAQEARNRLATDFMLFYFLVYFFDPGVGGDMFLWNVSPIFRVKETKAAQAFYAGSVLGIFLLLCQTLCS
jgi:hypothetical protein